MVFLVVVVGVCVPAVAVGDVVPTGFVFSWCGNLVWYLCAVFAPRGEAYQNLCNDAHV